MYFLIAILLMGLFPIASVITEYAVLHGHADLMFLIGRWFVFWVIGVRLLVLGLTRILEPSQTAKDLFGIEDANAQKLVAESGFAALAIGALGMLTLINEAWITPAAIVGGIYYGLAGAKHILYAEKTPRAMIAAISDLAMFVLFVTFIAAEYLTYLQMARP